MRIIVISPESADAREVPAMQGLFAAGLERYHVRKPSWSETELEAWLSGLPQAWRPRIMLHQHPGLVARLGLGGAHERDSGPPQGSGTSRSCHDVATLRTLLGAYGSVIFGPVFASLTKKGYSPAADFPWDALKAALSEPREPVRTSVFAIGGVDGERLARCRDLGFDGAALLGAVWHEADPVRAFTSILQKARQLEATRHAA
jgi:thiamine-phosphate pyrophosphorylase